MIYYLWARYVAVWFIRLRNSTRKKRALIKQIASREWEQQRLIDHVLQTERMGQ